MFYFPDPPGRLAALGGGVRTVLPPRASASSLTVVFMKVPTSFER